MPLKPGVDDSVAGTAASAATISLIARTPQKQIPTRLASPSPSNTSHNFNTCPEDDGSQGWCIVICCFLVNVVVMGFLKCLGILIIEVRKSYKATPSDVSVLVSITACLNCVAGPFACYLVCKFTARTIAFMGTVLVALGLMLSWFATSITLLYFTIGVLVGLGSGFTYSPGLILIGNYFKKNRGMANGIAVSGSPVGGMLMPYMLNFLIRYLDCRGALLILGGLMMNAVVCTLSYKPYKPPRQKKAALTVKQSLLEPRRTEGSVNIPDECGSSIRVIRGPDKDYENDSDESSGPEFNIDEGTGFLKSVANKTKKHSSTVSGVSSVIVFKINEKYGQANHHKKGDNFPRKNPSKPPFWTQPDHDVGKMRKLSGTGQNIEAKASQTAIHMKKEENKIVHPFSSFVRRAKGSGGTGGSFDLQQSSTRLNTGSTNMKSGFLNSSQTGSQTLESEDSTVRNRRPTKDKDQRPSLPQALSAKKLRPYILSLDHSCVIMWSNDNVTKGKLTRKPSSNTIIKLFEGGGDQINVQSGSQIDDGLGEFVSPSQNPVQKKSCCSRCITWIRNSPLTNSTYLILLFSNASTAIATTNILLLIPALGEHRGLSKAESSTVYLIVFGADLCSRLCGSLLYDCNYISPKLIFATGLLCAGLSSFFIGMSDTFLKFCCFGGMFGFASGLHIGIFGTLLAEVVGIALLPMGYAFCMILNGVLQFSFINISGKILSLNAEAYANLYFFYGITLVLGGSLWLIPFISGRIRKLQLCKKRPQLKDIGETKRDNTVEK